ncbi:hypothetical protein [Azospirillum soli]|uniref:hypothetical protein n=1 Tax=Azospirillum soli TaxID=1304799 RepID=UPI001AE5C386|nr:hypothetical protein [Azospirillum soli]MBP2311846.1 hypothetical protein [Azospirillum soli]
MTAALHKDIAAVAAALDEARAQAETGAPIDMTGLDARVAELCGTAQASGDKTLLADLESLLRALDALAEALARQQDSMAAAAEGRPDPHTARQRAAAAYGRGASPGALPDPLPEKSS